MKKTSKYFLGMTQTQQLILGGLAFLAILSICGLGYLILSNAGVSRSVLPPLTQVVVSPTALIVGDAASPTLEFTPIPEFTLTPTFALPATPPAGWVKFETPGAELWLPDSFVGGDMTIKRKETIQKVNKLGKRYSDVVDSMKAEDETTLLFMADKNIIHNIITEVKVEHLILKQDISLKDYIQETYVSEGDLVVIIYENKKMTLLGYEARRLTYQSRLTSGLEGTVIEYALKDGLNVWFVAYILPPDQILDAVPMIEQSIATFNFVE